jgi:hypothetical protein
MPCKGDLLVDVKFRNGRLSSGPVSAILWEWDYCRTNRSDIIAWRPHKPETQWVPLEPDDIVVGMEFESETGTRYQWSEVDIYGVTLGSNVSFNQLQRDGWQYRINRGEWKPCKKEVKV